MSSQPRARRLRGGSGPSAWDLALRSPSAHLKPFVQGDYVGYTERTAVPVRRREFPGPFVVMVIELGPPVRIYEEGDPRRVTSHRGGFVGGLCEEFAVCEHDGFQQGVQVNLTPIGARRLFDIPMSELNAAIFSIQDLLPAPHRQLGEHLANLRDWDARFDLLEQTLRACLHEAGDRTRVVSWAVRRIEEAGGALSMRRGHGSAETEHALCRQIDRAAAPVRPMATAAASPSSCRTASAPSAWPTSSSSWTAPGSRRSARTTS